MQKIFLRKVIKNKRLLIGFICVVIFIKFVHVSLKASDKIEVFSHFGAPKVEALPLDHPRNYLRKYPFLLECAKNLSQCWSHNQSSSNAPFNYSQSAPQETHDKRIIRGVLVYFPIGKLDYFMLEFKWLYRSWIEMQKYEPKNWRTDLIVFIENDTKILSNQSSLFNRLNCEFTNKRLSELDKPMCTLIDFKPLEKRNISIDIFKSYESILDETNIFENGKDLDQFYSLLKKNIINYGYSNSILMAFEGYDYFKLAKYDFLLRTDMDVFLTPFFSKWLPINCGFYVGRGGFSNDFNDKRFRRISRDLNLGYAGSRNLGSTWYSTPNQFRLVSYLTLFGMAYLSVEEFTRPEREGKAGTLLWPEWHYGVLLLYGQSLGMNHLIATKQINVIPLPDLIDFPSGNSESIFKILHIHVFHGEDLFSKFVFKMGRYDNMTVSEEDAQKVKFYSLKMALEGKKHLESKLLNDLNVEGAKKT